MEKTFKDFYRTEETFIEEIYMLQVELVKLQRYIHESGKRLAILFEGRDTAGKGSAINRFTQYLNPRSFKVVALGKPSEVERGQWYFQRYIHQLPNAGEISFFDRSWYNRAVVEPVMGFCTKGQYQLFMQQVNLFERMLVDDGIIVVKFWFSINMMEQEKRIKQRLETPLIQWKVSPVDLAAQGKWDEFTKYKNLMFTNTNSDRCPWSIVRGDSREDGRVQAIRYILSLFDYPDAKEEARIYDPAKIFRP